VADLDWRTHFPDYHVKIGDPHYSDHRPIIVTVGEGGEFVHNDGGRRFCFEAGWVGEENCEENCEVIVNNAWRLSMNTRARKVAEAIKDVAGDLWDCVTPGPIWMAHEWPMSAGARV
jgi:hypothetical protein